jgi:hypothetical protein
MEERMGEWTTSVDDASERFEASSARGKPFPVVSFVFF